MTTKATKAMRFGTMIDGCTVLAHDPVTKFTVIYAKDDYLAKMARNTFVHYRVGKVECYPDGRPAYMADAPTAIYFADLRMAAEQFNHLIDK